jgi:hypothetical protein
VEQLQVQYTAVPVMEWTGSTQLIKAREVNYMGGQESRSGGCDSFSEDDQEGTEGASDRGPGRHGHREGQVVAPACLRQLSTGRQSYPDEVRVPSPIHHEGDLEA